MTTWRHTIVCDCGEYVSHCGADWCHCTTPTPDPASPCGYIPSFTPCGGGEGHPFHTCRAALYEHEPIDTCHPHVPTLCATCHHAIEEATDA